MWLRAKAFYFFLIIISAAYRNAAECWHANSCFVLESAEEGTILRNCNLNECIAMGYITYSIYGTHANNSELVILLD